MLGARALVFSAAGGAAALLLGLLALYGPPLRRYLLFGSSGVPFATYMGFSARVRLQRLALKLSGVSRALAPLPLVDELAPGVVRVLGCNPSRMTLQGTNTYLLGAGEERVLIDASDGNDAHVAALLDVCARLGVARISHLLLTHGHYDHIGGVLRVREAFPDVQVWKCLPPEGSLRVSNAESARLGIKPLRDGAEFRVAMPGGGGEGDAVVRAVHTPGHHDDHACFLVTHGRHVALFSGDCVLGEGSCVFDSLQKLMASLGKLRALSPDVIYPAHGPVVPDAMAKIDEYIAHRLEREQQVLGALEKAASAPAASLSSAQIVREIYEELPFLLRLAAQKAVDKHLRKLEAERRVRRKAARGWFASPTYQLVG